jgi:hypothetical protein
MVWDGLFAILCIFCHWNGQNFMALPVLFVSVLKKIKNRIAAIYFHLPLYYNHNSVLAPPIDQQQSNTRDLNTLYINCYLCVKAKLFAANKAT